MSDTDKTQKADPAGGYENDRRHDELRRQKLKTLVDQGINEQKLFWSQTFPKWLNILMVVLSFGLIGVISYDVYFGIDFLENTFYMNFQLAVCIVFILEFFYRLFVAKRTLIHLILYFPFLLISIPYLNLIEYFHLTVSSDALSFIRFIPMIRGMAALTIVLSYATRSLTTTVLASYVLVLLTIVYMSGLIFYIEEYPLNPNLKNFWYAMWWSGMNVTTIGCFINPITPVGMALGLLLSLCGIIMFPLFTVYFGAVIQKYSHKGTNSKSDCES